MPPIITFAAFLVAGDRIFVLRVATFKLKSKVAKASFLPVSCQPKINRVVKIKTFPGLHLISSPFMTLKNCF